VTQDVLLKLHRLMARFVYDPSGSFRAWLKTLTHHAWRDLVAERRQVGLEGSDRSVVELLASLQAGDDLLEQLKDGVPIATEKKPTIFKGTVAWRLG
jgi:RNA polymerase sigma-70 factor (ECF subfamily)